MLSVGPGEGTEPPVSGLRRPLHPAGTLEPFGDTVDLQVAGQLLHDHGGTIRTAIISNTSRLRYGRVMWRRQPVVLAGITFIAFIAIGISPVWPEMAGASSVSWSAWQPMSGPGLAAGPVAVGPGSNGSLQELFVAGPQGQVWADYEAPGGAWSGWHAMSAPGLAAGPVAVGPGSNGSLEELFVAGPQGRVWEDYEASGGVWSGWHAMSGVGLAAGAVAVGPGSNGSLQELFVADSQGEVWEDYEASGGVWSGWHAMSGWLGLAAGAVAVAVGPGR